MHIWRMEPSRGSFPDVNQLKKFDDEPLPPREQFSPMLRNDITLARPWASPGLPGYEHRIGGLEKDYNTGRNFHRAYEPRNGWCAPERKRLRELPLICRNAASKSG